MWIWWFSINCLLSKVQKIVPHTVGVMHLFKTRTSTDFTEYYDKQPVRQYQSDITMQYCVTQL